MANPEQQQLVQEVPQQHQAHVFLEPFGGIGVLPPALAPFGAVPHAAGMDVNPLQHFFEQEQGDGGVDVIEPDHLNGDYDYDDHIEDDLTEIWGEHFE
jgi:hypothetical protein